MIGINKHPSRRDLLIFASILPFFFGIVGALRWHAGSPRSAVAIWAVGLALTLLVFALPPLRRWLYLGWMYALFPVAWLVSRAILVAMYLLVATPIALVMRALGQDPLRRAFDKSAPTYWVTRQPKRGAARYFRQF